MFSPNTGIISAHGLMDYFSGTSKEQGTRYETHCTVVVSIEHTMSTN